MGSAEDAVALHRANFTRALQSQMKALGLISRRQGNNDDDGPGLRLAPFPFPSDRFDRVKGDGRRLFHFIFIFDLTCTTATDESSFDAMRP